MKATPVKIEDLNLTDQEKTDLLEGAREFLNIPADPDDAEVFSGTPVDDSPKP